MPWQPAGVMYPDAELVIITKFRAALVARGQSDVYLSNRIPTSRRDRMVIFTRDGGSAGGMRDRPRMRARVWGSTDQGATDLARLVVAIAPTLKGSAPILHAEILSGPYEVPDESGQPQRYCLFEFHLRGEPA